MSQLSASEGESVHGGSAGSIDSSRAGWESLCGVRTRHHGDGHHSPSGANGAIAAVEGISCGWNGLPFRRSARDLLWSEQQRQRNQYEFRVQVELVGATKSAVLRQSA